MAGKNAMLIKQNSTFLIFLNIIISKYVDQRIDFFCNRWYIYKISFTRFALMCEALRPRVYTNGIVEHDMAASCLIIEPLHRVNCTIKCHYFNIHSCGNIAYSSSQRHIYKKRE